MIRTDIFFEDDEPAPEDLALFKTHPGPGASDAEKDFFKKMEKKVFGEFAPSADLLMSEHNNHDEIYIVRYYFSEFRIGQGLADNRFKGKIYTLTFAEALEADLFQFLDRHVTLLEWLREIDFKGLDFNGNYALH